MTGEPKPRLELWVWVALSVALATAGLFLYLGVRPGGSGPIAAYVYGRTLLFLAGAAVLLFGIVWSVVKRPVMQRGRGMAFLGLAMSLFFCQYPLPYPSSHEKSPSATRFRLPFEGEWVVGCGGSRLSENPYVLLPDRRFGFVFKPGEGNEGDGAVVAPAAGEVVLVHTGEPERGEEHYGNLVVLRTAEAEYAFLAGLETVSAAVGQEVAAGDALGRVGASSSSPVLPYPHVAVWLQDNTAIRRGEGIPMYFHGYAEGERTVERGIPTGGLSGGGQRVRHAPAPADG